MKFKGKPITDASKLPPCMFSGMYDEKKDKSGGKRTRKKGKRRRKSRKGGSGRKKNVIFVKADDIYSMLRGTVEPSSVLNLDNTLSPISISRETLLEEGRSGEIPSSVSNKPKSPYTKKKKSNLKKIGGKRRTRKRRLNTKRKRGGGPKLDKKEAEKTKQEIELTRPLREHEYEEWYEAVAEKELNSQLHYINYVKDYNSKKN
jgi:hypothetical protein